MIDLNLLSGCEARSVLKLCMLGGRSLSELLSYSLSTSVGGPVEALSLCEAV